MASFVQPIHNASRSVGLRDHRDEDRLRALMRLYQEGDSAAVEELIERLSPVLMRFLASPSLSPADVEDLLQNCWLRIHRSRHSYRLSDPVLPWMFAIARHTRLDAYRKRRRRESREVLVAEAPEIRRAPDASLQVLPLLDQLPESQRDVIVMLKIVGMSLEEVARATSSSVGAIKQKAHRAYASLRRMLEEGV